MRHTICSGAQDRGYSMAAVSGDNNQISVLFLGKTHDPVLGCLRTETNLLLHKPLRIKNKWNCPDHTVVKSNPMIFILDTIHHQDSTVWSPWVKPGWFTVTFHRQIVQLVQLVASSACAGVGGAGILTSIYCITFATVAKLRFYLQWPPGCGVTRRYYQD